MSHSYEFWTDDDWRSNYIDGKAFRDIERRGKRNRQMQRVCWYCWTAIRNFFLHRLEIFKCNVYVTAYNIYCLDFSSRYINIIKTDTTVINLRPSRRCVKTIACVSSSLTIEWMRHFDPYELWTVDTEEWLISYDFDWLFKLGSRKSSCFMHWI